MNTNEEKHGGMFLAQAVKAAYSRGQTDYSMEPLVRLGSDGKPLGLVQDGDAVIFCCRRGEREIELTEAFTEAEFPHFKRKRLNDLDFVILTLYHDKFKDLPVAFAPAQWFPLKVHVRGEYPGDLVGWRPARTLSLIHL